MALAGAALRSSGYDTLLSSPDVPLDPYGWYAATHTLGMKCYIEPCLSPRSCWAVKSPKFELFSPTFSSVDLLEREDRF
jgi:hypothetical protein